MRRCALLFSALLAVNSLFAGQPYELFPYGAVKPEGWIRNQMINDIREGLPGNYDKINFTVNYELFAAKDRYSDLKYDKVGEPGQLLSWWSGEHEAYWKESMIRLAYLTGDEASIRRADKWVGDILASQDQSGYIGIYGTGRPGVSRLDHNDENGEFWTQGLMLSALLSYYEMTGRKEVLDAVVKATDLTMKAYASKTTFEQSKGGGVSHAVGYFELLEWLYRLTGDQKYKDFTLKMWKDLNGSILRDDDLKTAYLLDMDRKMAKHGAHIGEGFFVPQFVAELTGDPSDRQAAENALLKFKYHSTPSGALVCDEHIRGMEGNGDNLYEYCTTVELVNSLDKVMAMRGDLEVADMIEKATFNAMQGARLPDLKALSYLTQDNRLNTDLGENQGRKTYDACHKAAACCTLSGGRMMPFYVHGMWMHDAAGREIVASLYGPCILDTEIDGTKLSINEKTNYPFGDDVTFEVKLAAPKTFALVLRKPHGVKNIGVEGVPASQVKDMGDRLVIDRNWAKSTRIEVDFRFDVQFKNQNNAEYYVQRGPIVYAVEMPYTSKTIREHGNSGFTQTQMDAENQKGWSYSLDKTVRFTFVPVPGADTAKPFFAPVVELKGEMADSTGKKVPVRLVPMGNTVLRRVTFPEAK